jgi:TonB family protein
LTRVLYLPPPNPTPAPTGSAETIQYVEVAPDGMGAGMVSEGLGVELELGRGEEASVGNAGRDSLTAAAREGWQGVDSVFTMIEVDTIAARLPESAAPQYPPDLLARRVEGQAVVQFVVDTTGLADPSSFVVVLSSHPDFAQSIRDALPRMRFSTARIGATKVRQLVELPFSFTIAILVPLPAESTILRSTKVRRPD